MTSNKKIFFNEKHLSMTSNKEILSGCSLVARHLLEASIVKPILEYFC